MPRTYKVLLIENSADDEALVRAHVDRGTGVDFSVLSARSLREGLEALAEGDFLAILLDLNLPDSHGLESLTRVLEAAASVPVVVLTGHEEWRNAVECLRHGAEDFHPKSELEGSSLKRTLLHAIERRRVRADLGRSSNVDEERAVLGGLSLSTSTPVAASLFGVVHLKDIAPDRFESLVAEYVEALELAAERRTYKIESDVTERLRSIAEELGFLRAGPRDVLDMHTAALAAISTTAPRPRQALYADEGRLVVLELMGHVAAYYRLLASGAPRPFRGELSESGLIDRRKQEEP